MVTKGKTTADGFANKLRANKTLAIIKYLEVINERKVIWEFFSKYLNMLIKASNEKKAL